MSNSTESNERLFQQLLELEHGLLDESEALALRQRIQTEAEVAQVHAKVLHACGLLAEAAIVDVPSMEFRKPVDRVYSSAPAKQHLRWLTPLMGLAAALLLAVNLGREWWFARETHRIANQSVVINVAGPSSMVAGEVTPFEIQTQNIRFEPVASQVDISLIDRSGRSILQNSSPQIERVRQPFFFHRAPRTKPL